MSLRVLLIDDDARLFELLGGYLAQNEVVLSHAPDGPRGLAMLAAEPFDAVLLDVMMPGMNGLEVCKRIRTSDNVPILMLTARGDEADWVVGLELGADDYVPKPFSPRELLARVRAVLRRARPEAVSERLQACGISVDTSQRQAAVDGRRLELTGLEFDLLVALVRRAGRVIPRDALLSEAGRSDTVVSERTVDVHISHLRQKLGDDPRDPRLIKTVRGVGYVLSKGPRMRGHDHRLRHHRVPYFFRLQRRLFFSFGLTILITAGLVAGVGRLVSDDSWRQDSERLKRLVGGEFARVWDVPEQRAALAERIARELEVQLEVRDARGAVVQRVGAACGHTLAAAPVLRDGVYLGEVRGCAERLHTGAWRYALPFLVVLIVLWTTAGRLSRRILRPLSMVVRVAEDLGAGKLGTRAEMACYRNGEERIVAESLNRMADRIERQLADQRELLAAVSHEMRTPLGHMRIITELAREGALDQKALGELEKEIAELDTLVGDLLANSRLQFATLSLQPLDGAELGARALERAGLPPTVLAVQGTVALSGDATLLSRALANLLENARRHGSGATRLLVREEAGQVAFAVEDLGPGIPEGGAAQLFEAFQRGRGSAHGSLGLGLNLVRRIAQAHGGDAWAENREGGGARVGFRVQRSTPG